MLGAATLTHVCETICDWRFIEDSVFVFIFYGLFESISRSSEKSLEHLVVNKVKHRDQARLSFPLGARPGLSALVTEKEELQDFFPDRICKSLKLLIQVSPAGPVCGISTLGLIRFHHLLHDF